MARSGVGRQDLEEAIGKAAELRALHAALLQAQACHSPAALLRFPTSNQDSGAEDYPVFTPSCEEDLVPANRVFRAKYRGLSQTWSGAGLDEEGKDDDALTFDKRSVDILSTSNSEQNVCTGLEHVSYRSSCINPLLHIAQEADTVRSSSKTSGEYKSITKCDPRKPPAGNVEIEDDKRKLEITASGLQLLDPYKPMHLPAKQRGPIFSWLLSKSKKKPKPEMLPTVIESENMSQLLKDWGLFSLESLKKELIEANRNRDAALAEVEEMRSSLGELQHKLGSLEAYCEELKKALKQAVSTKGSLVLGRTNQLKKTKAAGVNKDTLIPVSHEVMVEGFLQIVSEARLSVKQFCKILIHQTGETDDELTEKLNLLLVPYQMTLSNGYSKSVLYHLQGLVNQSLYQNFENCAFQNNGSPKFLDPQQERRENFSSFVALRNLSWNEVLRKGTKYYSEDFSKFCDQKMSCIASLFNWSKPWPEQLLQCFFVTAKCIWLLHLLAFSFSPSLMILRVEEDSKFDSLYMEDIPLERRAKQAPSQVKIMVMPGFYVQDKVLKCRVLCR